MNNSRIKVFFVGCAGIVFTALADDALFYLAPGQSQEVGNATVAFTNVVVDGALTLKSGAAVTVNETGLSKVASTNGINASVTMESGSSMTIIGSDTSNTTPSAHNIAVGFLGGTGTVAIASGATLTVQNTRFWLGGNVSGATRGEPSCGVLNISGTMTAPNLECTPYFPDISAPYAPSSYPVGAIVNLEEGGVLRLYVFQRNDAGMTLLNFNGGTLKAAGDNSTFFIGGGAIRVTIADGKTGSIDTDGHNIVISPADTERASLLAITGTGTFVKKGNGILTVNIGSDYDTFTGPIQVQAGTLALGRPLADGQTVTVSDGATFIPYSSTDISKVSPAATSQSLYTVQANHTDGLDLAAMADSFFTDRLGGPFSGLSATLSGAVTHADVTTAAPFQLIGQSNGSTLTLSGTGLESVPVEISGPGTMKFANSRTLSVAENGYVKIDSDGSYQQGSDFIVGKKGDTGTSTFSMANGGKFTAANLRIGNDTNSISEFYASNATVTVSSFFDIGYQSGHGTATIEGGTLTANEIRIGSNPSGNDRGDSTGTLNISNATVTAAGYVRLGANGLNNATDRATVKNRINLYDGASLYLNEFRRNDDPRSRITFAGGKTVAKQNDDQFFYSAQAGVLEIEAAAGHDIVIDTQGYNIGFNASGTNVLFGAGGLYKLGSGILKWSSSLGVTATYTGDTTVKEGILQIFRGNVIPDGAGVGDLVLKDGAALNMYGFCETVNMIDGFGTVSNSTANTVEMNVLGNDADGTLNASFAGPVRLVKNGTGTLTLGSNIPDGGLVVAKGTAHVVGASAAGFKHYRFSIDAVKGSGANSSQISEFKLLNGDTDVTGVRSGIAYVTAAADGGTTYPRAEIPDYALDGNVNTKWLSYLAAPSRSAAVRAQAWLQIDYAAAQVVTGYNWATANDSGDAGDLANRDPSAWRLLASNDGTNWVAISTVTGFVSTTDRNAWVSENGFGCYSLALAKPITVEDGATLILDGATVNAGNFNSKGTVLLQNGASLRCVANAGVTNTVSGILQGDGSLSKVGTGTAILASTNAYLGATAVHEGTLTLGTFAPKFFRITFKRTLGSTATPDAILQLSEFALYSADGMRQNLGLTQAATGVNATNLVAGTFTKAAAYPSGKSTEEPYRLFDGDTSTKWCATTQGHGPVNSVNSATWRVLTLRLLDTADPVTSYNFSTANDSGERDPITWTLEASIDGVNWFVADAQDSITPPSARLAAYPMYTVSQSQAGAISAVSSVSVDTGATLEVTDTDTVIGALRVDCTAGGGTVTILNPGVGGVLSLDNFTAATRDGYEIPLAIGTFVNADNLSTWKVYINGIIDSGVMVLERGGKLCLVKGGTVMILK